VLGRETLSGGGYLVSMKTPQSVQVEAWLPGPRGRAVRCGAEISALGARPGAKPWLDDPAAVAEAGTSIDVICRSVTDPR
jgi:hypothetical protein